MKMTENKCSSLQAFYDKRANDDFVEYYKSAPFSFKAREFLEQVFQCGFRPFARLLDVGCGPGLITANLLGSIQVVGIDLSPEMIRKAQVTRSHGHYFVHDFHDPLPSHFMPFGSNDPNHTIELTPFDVMFASGAFDLCNDLQKAFSSLSAKLKEQGLFYFTIPEYRPGTPNNGKRELLARPLEPEIPVWLHFFSFEEVAEALAQNGLVPISYQYAEGYRSNSLGICIDYGYWVVLKKPAADFRP